MAADYRAEAVRFYDRFSGAPAGDVDFYRAYVTPTTRVLELGCGTGRVLVPIAEKAAYVRGLDLSPAMLALCREKFAVAGIDSARATIAEGDIADFDLGSGAAFDLVIAPFRVMQNLETDAQVHGFMRGIKRHLARDGTAILNTFNPRPREEIETYWRSFDGRTSFLVTPDGDGTVATAVDCTRFRDDPLTVFPELIYRRFDAAGREVSESRLNVAMRVWYSNALLELIESHGFVITARFGGYAGETWGEGPELVAAFRHA